MRGHFVQKYFWQKQLFYHKNIQSLLFTFVVYKTEKCNGQSSNESRENLRLVYRAKKHIDVCIPLMKDALKDLSQLLKHSLIYSMTPLLLHA